MEIMKLKLELEASRREAAEGLRTSIGRHRELRVHALRGNTIRKTLQQTARKTSGR